MAPQLTANTNRSETLRGKKGPLSYAAQPLGKQEKRAQAPGAAMNAKGKKAHQTSNFCVVHEADRFNVVSPITPPGPRPWSSPVAIELEEQGGICSPEQTDDGPDEGPDFSIDVDERLFDAEGAETNPTQFVTARDEILPLMQQPHSPSTTASSSPNQHGQGAHIQGLMAQTALVESTTSDRRPLGISLEEALEQCRAADATPKIGDAIVSFLRSTFGCGLIFIVRNDLALGWKGFAPGVEPDIIESMAFPLGSGSMLQMAFSRMAPYRGGPPKEGALIQERMWKLLKCDPPEEVIVYPLRVKDRVVNLVYAHAFGGGKLADVVVEELAKICNAGGQAYLRVIELQKQKKPAGTPSSSVST
jgi:hypothetical protein